MNRIQNVHHLIGRILIGVYFLGLGALAKIFNYNFVYKYMLEHEVPFTHIALVLTIIIQFICSVGIIIGWHSKVSAFVLALLTIIINYYMHDFWDMSSGIQQEHELQNFVKNMGIIAGLLILSAANPGKYSIKT